MNENDAYKSFNNELTFFDEKSLSSSTPLLIKKSVPRKKQLTLNNRSLIDNKYEKYLHTLEETLEQVIKKNEFLQKVNYQQKLEIIELNNQNKLIDLLKAENVNLLENLRKNNEELSTERKKVVNLQIQLLRLNIVHDNDKKSFFNEKNELLKSIDNLRKENDKLKDQSSKKDSSIKIQNKTAEFKLKDLSVTLEKIDDLLGNKNSDVSKYLEKSIRRNSDKLKKLNQDKPVDSETLGEKIDDSNLFKTVGNNELQNTDIWNFSITAINKYQEDDILIKKKRNISKDFEIFLNCNKSYNNLLTNLKPHLTELVATKTIKIDNIRLIVGNLYTKITKKNINIIKNFIKRFNNDDLLINDIKSKTNFIEIDAPNVKKKKDLVYELINICDYLIPNDILELKSSINNFDFIELVTCELFKLNGDTRTEQKKLLCDNIKYLMQQFQDFIIKTILDNRKNTFRDLNYNDVKIKTEIDDQDEFLSGSNSNRPMVKLEVSQINKLLNFELLDKTNEHQELSKKRTRSDKELANSNDNPAKRKKTK